MKYSSNPDEADEVAFPTGMVAVTAGSTITIGADLSGTFAVV